MPITQPLIPLQPVTHENGAATVARALTQQTPFNDADRRRALAILKAELEDTKMRGNQMDYAFVRAEEATTLALLLPDGAPEMKEVVDAVAFAIRRHESYCMLTTETLAKLVAVATAVLNA